MKKAPIIQRVACTLHADKVAAICSKCYDLAERQMQAQWAKERKVAHQEYLAREQSRTHVRSTV